LIVDAAGNLYGSTTTGGTLGGGTIFQLTPDGSGFTFKTIYSFAPGGIGSVGPLGNLLMDKAGNLYGTTWSDGLYSLGAVFKLTRSGESWSYSSIHDFNRTDGAHPSGDLIMDANGNIYGTADNGGANCYPNGCGVIFEITP
jgi:hypothetical protein